MRVCAVDGRVGVSEGKGGGGRMKGNEPIFEWTFLPSMDDAMTSELSPINRYSSTVAKFLTVHRNFNRVFYVSM